MPFKPNKIAHKIEAQMQVRILEQLQQNYLEVIKENQVLKSILIFWNKYKT